MSEIILESLLGAGCGVLTAYLLRITVFREAENDKQ